MAKASSTKKPVKKLLIEIRNDIIVSLHEEGYGPTDIGFIMNRPKQTVSDVVFARMKSRFSKRV